MSVDFEFSSPLTLLRQWRDKGWDLTDALVIGYTVDLPFLERYFISTARALGARITILADAHQAIHDDGDVRHAGRTYMYAPVLCEGAFHPKLAVLANDTDIWVAIGSGNPTTSGWGHNRELWLAIRTTRESGPQALVDLATWLTDLPMAVTMPGWIGETLADIALRLIPNRVEETFSELRIVGNLEQAIIDQLPNDPVDELSITAPFFDPKSRAVTRLIQRLRPKSVSLALQPNLSHFDGPSLVRAMQQVTDHHVRYLAENSRLSHGKLIEWTTEGRRRALIGSPNISTAALLRTPRQGANCELAVLHMTDSTLLPPGIPGATGDLLTRHTFPAQQSRPELDTLILLGARLSPDGLEVELVTRAPASVIIEISADGGPDGWIPVHSIEVIEQGHHLHHCPVRERDGTAVRASTSIDGIVHTSRVVFVTDPHRCRARSTAPAGPRLTRDHNPESFFVDTDLAARFRKDFDDLLLAAAAAVPKGWTSTPQETRGTEAPDDDRWGTWIGTVEEVLKPSLTGLLFGHAVATIPRIATQSWSVDIDEGTDITEDENEEDIDPLMNLSALHLRAVPTIEDTERDVWRKWDRRLRQRIVGAGPCLPVELRLLAVRLHLDLLAAGLRGPDEQDWTDDLVELLRELLPNAESAPEEVVSTIGALLAIGTMLLFEELRQDGGLERDFRAQKLWSSARHIIALTLGLQLVQEHRPAVELLVERARTSATDPTADTRVLLADKGITAAFHDGAWVSRIGSKKNQLATAATIATTVGAPCAALVIGDDESCVVLWAGDDIAHIETRRQRWRLYRVVVGTPMSTLVTSDGLGGARRNIPLSKPDPEITRLCSTIGVSPELLRMVLTGLK